MNENPSKPRVTIPFWFEFHGKITVEDQDTLEATIEKARDEAYEALNHWSNGPFFNGFRTGIRQDDVFDIHFVEGDKLDKEGIKLYNPNLDPEWVDWQLATLLDDPENA